MRIRLAIAGALSLLAVSAQATLFHPEYLKVGLRQSLIDCEHGFGPALREYFGHDAASDGVPIARGTLTVKVDRAIDQWISHFELTDGTRHYRGIVYVEPPLDDGDDDDGPPPMPPPRTRACSASFVDDAARPDELAQIAQAYARLCIHFGVKP